VVPATAPVIGDSVARLAAQLRRITVEIRGRDGFGSGVIWSAEGLIVTSAHVARGPASIALADGRVIDARVHRRDLKRDLAVLVVDAGGLPAAEIGDSAALHAGEMVFAVGSPFGATGAVAIGVIHAVGSRGHAGAARWIVADLRLAPGNSGGPLADARGRVVGINAMIHGGLALAVPSRTVLRLLDGR
jgi:serine protease Do